MSDDAKKVGFIQWHPSVCRSAKWLCICIQLAKMQRDIERSKEHTPGTGLNV